MLEQIQLSQLPENAQLAVSTTIPGHITEIKLLSGGLSQAQVIRIDTNSKAYLLKISQPASIESPVFHQLAAASGIAPAVHYSDAGKGILITDLSTTIPFRQRKLW